MILLKRICLEEFIFWLWDAATDDTCVPAAWLREILHRLQTRRTRLRPSVFAAARALRFVAADAQARLRQQRVTIQFVQQP